MKELYLIRHAKSDWNDPSLSDFDRPLNPRGMRNAPMMGKLLAKESAVPDLIVSSPALRAKTTALIFAQALQVATDAIRFEPSIYEASVQSLLYLVAALPDDAERIFLFGHNPGLTELANLLGDLSIENMPTASVVGIRFEVDAWHDAGKRRGKTIRFEYPKKHLTC